MTATTSVLDGRQAAEALMVDECTIGPSSSRSFNVTTRDYDDDAAAGAVYTGKCKVQRPGRATDAEIGGDELGRADLEVHVPTGTTGIERGHMVMVTAAAVDGGLVGRRFRVLNVPRKSFATALRLPCEEVSG